MLIEVIIICSKPMSTVKTDTKPKQREPYYAWEQKWYHRERTRESREKNGGKKNSSQIDMSERKKLRGM